MTDLCYGKTLVLLIFLLDLGQSICHSTIIIVFLVCLLTSFASLFLSFGTRRLLPCWCTLFRCCDHHGYRRNCSAKIQSCFRHVPSWIVLRFVLLRRSYRCSVQRWCRFFGPSEIAGTATGLKKSYKKCHLGMQKLRILEGASSESDSIAKQPAMTNTSVYTKLPPM